MNGFHMAYMRVDLTTGESARVPIEAKILERVLGGVGLGSWLLHREAPVGVDPFAPEAPLVFAFSPLVGTGVTTSAKFAVVGKSPLTGGLCDALASSHFAIEGKRLGIDALVFVGECDEPSEWVNGILRPTQSWGRTAQETAAALSKEGRVAAIGIAGENRVRYATISAEGRHAGRGGLGAIMGAKRLKAIVVSGDHGTVAAHPEEVERQARRLRDRARGDATAKYSEIGTIGNLLAFDRMGALPTRNFQESHFEGAEALSAERWQSDRKHRRASCADCTIGCEHRYGYKAPGGKSKDVRIEYESLFALGPLCGVADPDLVLAAAAKCDALGLDTISAGATLAFAMECGERGELSGGPVFGDDPSEWLSLIATREGLGDFLAEGSRRMAESIGGDALSRAPQVKGLELPGYEPRTLQTMALGLAVGTRGADHNRSGAYEADFSEEANRLHGDARSVALAIESEDRAAVLDALVLCKFVRGAFDDLYDESATLLNAVTGTEADGAGIETIARRIVDLRKAFNIREGWQPEDDTLPGRFLTEPIPSGPAKGVSLPRERLDFMIRSYNLGRGWTEVGWLPKEALRRLEVELDLEGLRSSIERSFPEGIIPE